MELTWLLTGFSVFQWKVLQSSKPRERERDSEERFSYWLCSMVDCMVKLESGLVEEEPMLDRPGLRAKAGLRGVGNVVISPPSMKSTFDIVGRLLGSSCTHRRPTFIHFKTSSLLQLSWSTWSIMSIALFSVHSLHVCTNMFSLRL